MIIQVNANAARPKALLDEPAIMEAIGVRTPTAIKAVAMPFK